MLFRVFAFMFLACTLATFVGWQPDQALVNSTALLAISLACFNASRLERL